MAPLGVWQGRLVCALETRGNAIEKIKVFFCKSALVGRVGDA